MENVRDDRQKQINDIVSIVKVASLLFTAIIFCKYVFSNGMASQNSIVTYYTIICILLPLLIIMAMYCVWLFSTFEKLKVKNKVVFNKIETAFFIVLFSGVIYICGANESQYKFLYLFIIITTTIQFGMKHGVLVACISSVIILAMDIFMVPGAEVNVYFENDLILAGIFVLTAWPLGFYVKIEGEHIKVLENMVNIDGLTGAYNHRYFYDALRENELVAKENGKRLSMIFMDVDNFKHYNDLYGHQKGDEILRKISEIIQSNVRKSDIVARYGGDEFAIILPGISEEQAVSIGQRLRKNIENTYFYGEENQTGGKMTTSIGISVYPDKAKNGEELVKSADDALYRAKFFSKNRVEVYTSILDDIKNNIEDKDEEIVASIKTLIGVINAKDKYTYGHVERVVIYSRLMAEKLNLSEENRKKLIYGAYMHDIGKINISEDILMKKMKLTDDEWNQLKQHPTNGAEIIRPVKALRDIMPLIESHHERYDGKGYPHGFKGNDIPYLARILTVVDSFDAMTSNRPYNKRKTYEEGIDEVLRCSGTQFDPDIAKAFAEMMRSKRGRMCIEGITDNGEYNI